VRVVETERLIEIGERHRVVGLQVLLGVRGRQQRVDVDLVSGLLVLGRGELLGVIVNDRPLLRRSNGGVIELVEGSGKCSYRLDRGRSAGEDDQ
jgi:hypothetical protein